MRKVLKLKNLLPGSTFGKSVGILAGATAIGQAINVLASPVITRFYTPDDFGVLAVYVSLLGLISVIASLRYELAIPVANEDRTAGNLLVLCLFIVLLISSMVGLVAYLLGDKLSTVFGAPTLAHYLWLLPLGLLGTGIYQVLSYWAIRKKAFTNIARTRMTQSFGQVSGQLGLGMLHFGPLGLIIGQIIGQTTGITNLAALAWKNDREAFHDINMKNIKYAAARYRRFPLISSWSGMLNAAGLQLPSIFLAALYGPQVAGWYALAQRVIGMPLNMIGNAASQVYLGEAPGLNRQSPGALVNLFRTTAKRLFIISGVPALFLALTGPQLFRIIFGSTWFEAGLYTRILAPMLVVQFVVRPLSQTLNILERQDLQLIWDALRLALVVIALYGSYLVELPPDRAIAIYSIAMVLGYVILFFLSYFTLDKAVYKFSDTKKVTKRND